MSSDYQQLLMVLDQRWNEPRLAQNKAKAWAGPGLFFKSFPSLFLRLEGKLENWKNWFKQGSKQAQWQKSISSGSSGLDLKSSGSARVRKIWALSTSRQECPDRIICSLQFIGGSSPTSFSDQLKFISYLAPCNLRLVLITSIFSSNDFIYSNIRRFEPGFLDVHGHIREHYFPTYSKNLLKQYLDLEV